MSSNLVIVESPAKARTISRILGKDYQIEASMGHIRDLPEKGGLAIDIDNGFAPHYEVTESRKKVVSRLISLAKDADHIWLATDPDREGEAISWHLREVLEPKAGKATFSRVTFHEITPSAVSHSFKHPAEIDMDRTNAQQARRVLDRIVGFKVSPLVAQNVRDASSAGRVQSVAVRLVCDRQKEIDSFQAVEYWLLTASFDVGNGTILKAKLHKINGDKAEVGNETEANRLAAIAESAAYHVSAVTQTPKQRRPSPPFITSTLQQAASSHLRFSPDRTMRVAQQLYEGIDGGETSGLITYMRTDSFNISKDAQAAALTHIRSVYGAEYAPAKPNFYKSRGSAQEAHEAIRPTSIELTPERAARFLDDDQKKLYALIYSRFLASQMAPARQVLHAIEIDGRGPVPPTLTFRASATTTTFPGFLKAYAHGTDTGEDDDENDTPSLPDLKEKAPCGFEGLDREQKFTEPPPRFSEATLVRELEANGVGRPSTYAQTIRTIQQRGYVKKEKGRLAPTPLGMTANDFLVASLPELLDVQFTARMETELDQVESGQIHWQSMLQQFYDKFIQWMETARCGDAPSAENAERLLDLFHGAIKWQPARKIGRATYDDKKFVESFRKQLKDGKRLTNKQTGALLRLIATYREQLTKIDEAVAAAGMESAYQDAVGARRERQAEADAPPAPEVTMLLGALAKLEQWDPPTTRGKRTYDDRKFYESLRDQSAAGRTLSPAQVGALGKLASRYQSRIPGFETMANVAGVEVETVNPETQALIGRLLPLAAEIREWNEPAKGKAGRVFDDKEFFESISGQFQQKGNLSDRQVGALKRMIGKYKEQIPNFAERSSGIDFTPPPRAGGRGRARGAAKE